MSLNRSTASQILRGAYRGTPSQATVRAIGWLAGVTDEVAFAAGGQPAPGRPLAEELPAAADTLNDRERAVVLGIVRALLAQRQRVNEWKATTARALTEVIDGLPGDQLDKWGIDAARETMGLTWPNAARNMEHYFGVSGTPLEQNVGQMLTEIPVFQQTVDGAMRIHPRADTGVPGR